MNARPNRILVLQAIGRRAAALGADDRKEFDSRGGTIGRVPGNSWVLPDEDEFVSAYHARILFTDGQYFLEDTSTNGVCVNSRQSPLVRGRPYKLENGDQLFIDAYEITVSIKDENAGQGASVPPATGYGFEYPEQRPVTPPRFTPIAETGEKDPMKLLGLGGSGRTPNYTPGPRARDLGNGSPEREPLIIGPLREREQRDPGSGGLAPGQSGAGYAIPPGYNPLAVSQPAPKSVVERVTPGPAPPAVVDPPRTEGRSQGDFDFAAFMEGAGLPGMTASPELARDFGRILRLVVDGVMATLRARQQIKDQFRMRSTNFKATNNNPLKFSVNVEDALHNLLVKRNPAYLGTVDAFEDAFRDVRNHQMAMLAGIEVAYRAMLAEFDPGPLQADFDRQLKKGALLPVPARMRYWDLYGEQFRDRFKDPESCFRELFGDPFARAYEEQLARLRSAGPSDKK
jgi:type VI secretion system FHA domain protein